jgi:hypothetical protein
MGEVKNSQEFTCICGEMKSWITDGEEHPLPCMVCGRRYRGKYNAKTLQIEAIEIGGNHTKASRPCRNLFKYARWTWLWFLAFFHLSESAVCEMSKRKNLWNDYHDYRDAQLELFPQHQFTFDCKRCRKKFVI